MKRFAIVSILLALPCLWFPPAGLAEQASGETVLKRGVIAEDLYVAGGRVDVLADVDGDVLAAGGRVAIDSRVNGDLMVAGGTVTVHGHTNDDVRLIGGEVSVNGAIGDGLVVAAGNVMLAPGATVGGDALMSGGRVVVAGQVRGKATIGGGELIISGQIDGDVELAGRTIEIGPGAVVLGNLTYRSPEPMVVDPQARIEGTVTHIRTPMPDKGQILGCIFLAGSLLWLSLALTGVVLYLLFSRQAWLISSMVTEAPWKTLGLGLAVVAATPVVGVMLLSTAVGWLLAWLLASIYVLLLLIGFLIGALFLGSAALRRLRHGQESGRLGNSLAFALALLAVMIIALIPLFGWLLAFLVLLFGVGGISLAFYRRRSY